jgi:rhodanese-related sulfurtransferase
VKQDKSDRIWSKKVDIMKKAVRYLYYIGMGGLIFWFAYSKGWIFVNFESVTPKQAVTLLRNDRNITLLDVRTPEEFRNGHLRNATLLPLKRLEANLDKLTPLKTRKILVYCRSGSRSIAASRILEKHGFTPLNIKGGIIGLANAHADIIQ